MSYEFKGTPGPWRYGYDGPSLPIVMEENGLKIIGGCADKNGVEEANARAISAVPELIEALAELTTCFSASDEKEDSTRGKKIRNAHAALAKATGENQ